ncbi:MAG: hypothetical protein AAF611_14595 [Bacteroidota bacterium]
MKTRIILLIAGIFLLNSCVLKSLQPFYIQEAISFEKALVGNWNDQEKSQWHIVSFKTKLAEEKAKKDPLAIDMSAYFERYREGYFITYTKNDQEATFVAMPFKIHGKLFIDMTLIEDMSNNPTNLVGQHIIKAHTVAKVTISDDKQIRFDWLDDERIKELQKAEQIKLSYTTIHVDDTLLLTATSKELYQFLEKFVANNTDEVWGTSDYAILKPANAKP